MKLATFTHDGSTRLGVVTTDGIVDLAAAAPDLPRGDRGATTNGDPT